jgi:hypothetical protein
MTGKAHGTSSSNTSAPYELSLTPPVLADSCNRQLVQPDQSAVADENCGYAFIAAVEPSAAGQPGHGSLDHPSITAQPLRGLDALAGDAVAYGPSRSNLRGGS